MCLMEIGRTLHLLSESPAILRDLVSRVPPELLKVRRIPGKWSIHEHACHIVDVQPVLFRRFEKFRDEEMPHIQSYIPGETDPSDHLIEMNLNMILDDFYRLRGEMTSFLEKMPASYWEKKAAHDEYTEYSPSILLRHLLLHDHVHMYRIEELWLTKAR